MAYGMGNSMQQAGGGIGSLIGTLLGRQQRGQGNQDYYNAALQAQGQTPQNIQGINNFSPAQIQNLIQEQQTNQGQAGKRASLGIINPAYQNLPANVDPGYLYDYATATQAPIAKAKAQQQAEQETQGPLFEAQKQTYLQNPEAVYGADHPVTQFAKQYPDQWGSFVNAAKTQDQLEGMVKPFMGNREESQKLSNQQQQNQGEQATTAHTQAATNELNTLLPYKVEDYKNQLEGASDDNKSDFQQNLEDMNNAVKGGWLSPEQAHQAILTKMGLIKAETHIDQSKQNLELRKAQMHELTSQLNNKALSPAQKSLLFQQFQATSGVGNGMSVIPVLNKPQQSKQTPATPGTKLHPWNLGP